MEEKNINIILESLAETIQRLRIDIILFKAENERLRDENERLKELLSEARSTTNG